MSTVEYTLKALSCNSSLDTIGILSPQFQSAAHARLKWSINVAAGGALNVNAATNLTVMGSVFVGNEAQNGGGVCVQECAGRSTFFDNAFTSNWADKAGGGIFQLKCSGVRLPPGRMPPISQAASCGMLHL